MHNTNKSNKKWLLCHKIKLSNIMKFSRWHSLWDSLRNLRHSNFEYTVMSYDNKGDKVHGALEEQVLLLAPHSPSYSLLLVQLKLVQCDNTFVVWTLHSLDQYPPTRSFSCLSCQQKLIQPLQHNYIHNFVNKNHWFLDAAWYIFYFLKQKQRCNRVKILVHLKGQMLSS